jgi:hypothetical protein
VTATERGRHAPPRPVRLLTKTIAGLIVGALLIVCGPQPARSITLQELLEKHLSALGGEAALDTLRSFFVTGAIQTPTAGGHVRSWGKLPWEHRESIELGPVKKTVVFDGTAVWSVDHNGFMRQLSGPEKAQAAISAAIALYRYVRPLPPPFSAELLEEDGEHYRVSIRYGGEGEHVLYFGKDDYLLKKVVVEQFGFPTEAVFSDYRPEGGLLVAHRTVQSLGGTGLQITVTVERVVVNEVLPDSLFLAPASQVADGRFTGTEGPPEIPLDRVGPYLLADVTLNDSVTAPFLLDSGSGATCIDTSLVRALGLKSGGEIETRGVAGAGTASFVTLRNLSVPGATLSGQSVAAVDLASVREFVGGGMTGILGWDFLSRFVVQLDYRRGRMTLYDPQSFTYEGDGESLTARVQLNVPQVEAKVNGHRGWFVLDTGNGGSLMLHAPFVRASGLLLGRENLPGSIIRGIAGAQNVKFGRIDSLTLGSHTIRDVLAAFSTAEEGFLASEEVGGNIGSLVLERFTVYLDLQHERVFIEPNELASEAPAENLTGLVLTSRMGRVMVEQVLPGSPAESADIKPGAFVLEVDNRVADGLSPVEVGQLLRKPEGSTLHLKLERLGVPYEVDLTVRSFL